MLVRYIGRKDIKKFVSRAIDPENIEFIVSAAHWGFNVWTRGTLTVLYVISESLQLPKLLSLCLLSTLPVQRFLYCRLWRLLASVEV